MAEPIPPMIRHVFRSECPACGQKWLASHWDAFRYPLHYATAHLGIPPWKRPGAGVTSGAPLGSA